MKKIEGVEYVRDRGYVCCPECKLWVPLKGVSTAHCPKCNHELRVDDGGIKIIERKVK